VAEQVAPDERHIPAADSIASWGVPSAKYNNLSSYLTLRGPPMINVQFLIESSFTLIFYS
jgi:hypothetical protein